MTAAQALAALTQNQGQQERWHTCIVSNTNGDGTVDITYLDTTLDQVPCLNGFVPAVGDLVLVLASNEIGWMVFGRIPRRTTTDA